MTKEQARLRIEAQASDKEREAIADLVINSDCPLPEFLKKVDAAYESSSA
jgi:dephospho-CoA kinase